MLVRKKPVEVEAHRWFKNGDHPDDNSTMIEPKYGGEPFLSEGEVVRRYRNPWDSDSRVCSICGKIMLLHGWVDKAYSGLKQVCPGDWIVTNPDGTYKVVTAFEMDNHWEQVGPYDGPEQI